MIRIFKFLLPLLILAGAAWGYVQIRSGGVNHEQVAFNTRIPLVSAVPVRFERAVPNLRLYGTVESPELGLLTSAIEADVETVLVRSGERVGKGELLVRLDDDDILLRQVRHRAELQEIDARIESDKVRYRMDEAALKEQEKLLMLIGRSVERAKTLVRSEAGAKSALDAALQDEQRQRLAIIQIQKSINEFPSRQRQLEARKASIMAVLEQIDRELGYANVLAPFDGRVTDVMVVAGNRVARNGSLLSLYNEAGLELRVQIPSSVVPVLQNPMDTGIRIAGHARHHDFAIPIELDRFSALVEQGKGGVDAFFRSTGDALPALGTFLEILVNLPVTPDAVMLPSASLYDQDRVYVIDDGKLVARKARLLGTHSLDGGGHQVILDGRDFTQGELIMSTRLPQAMDGVRVQVEVQ